VSIASNIAERASATGEFSASWSDIAPSPSASSFSTSAENRDSESVPLVPDGGGGGGGGRFAFVSVAEDVVVSYDDDDVAVLVWLSDCADVSEVIPDKLDDEICIMVPFW
jgi:hypothetical protein